MSLPLYIIVAHFIADWAFQTDWMALNKSKSVVALSWHVTVYTLTMLGIMTLWMGHQPAGMYASIYVGHFITDFITSRITSKLWFFAPLTTIHPSYNGSQMWTYVEGRRHWFFVMIGFDQLIHYVMLAYTLKFLGVA